MGKIGQKFTNALAKVLAHPVVFDWLETRGYKTPYLHIMSQDGDEVYMYRYWLFNPYDAENKSQKYRWLPNIRLHHIMCPDSDRHLHDHPWDARTFILRGWYLEEKEGSKDLIPRKAGTTASLKYGEYHRIHQVSPGGVWTLFITWKYKGTWGFKVGDKKIPYREYLGNKEKYQNV